MHELKSSQILASQRTINYITSTPSQYPKSISSRPSQISKSKNATKATNTTLSTVDEIDVLIHAYNAVQAGSVKDPQTIRVIAKSFEVVANDPSIKIDAARAASNLYQQAKRIEESQILGTASPDIL